MTPQCHKIEIFTVITIFRKWFKPFLSQSRKLYDFQHHPQIFKTNNIISSHKSTITTLANQALPRALPPWVQAA
jgi:hypothetical protein